jgi:hypothetical protein
VAAPDLDQGDVFAGFGQVGEAAVAELVRGAAAAGGFEDLGAARVGGPGPDGVGVYVAGGGLAGGGGALSAGSTGTRRRVARWRVRSMGAQTSSCPRACCSWGRSVQ